MADAKFTEACFLMDYIKEIAILDTINAAYTGRVGFREIMPESQSAGGAHTIISKLTSRSGHKVFLNLAPATLAVLQPKIRRFKIIQLNSPNGFGRGLSPIVK